MQTNPPNPHQKPPAAAARQRPLWLNIVGLLLALIIVSGIIVLIVWLAIRPHRPVYAIVNATVHNYNLTDHDNRLTADFNFTIKAYNRNKRTSIKYKPLQAHLYFENEQIATATAAAFRQPARNTTYFPIFLQAKNVTLYGNTAKDFKKQRTAGKVELELKFRGGVRFKTGEWKWRHRRMKVTCKPTVMSYSSNKFKEVACHVDF
ncbi:unnamed protein product [Cuscuta europaea]|uniref:Late embryogenesis abundant protein LEA-2 subgroup domain-containing protein n=1 Tax=Cuscuta europaea TaxID=41803 RepID=A0A9P1A2C6_CUSEU|nr:unnamed protein product [Cuscuta europaea]